jgi:hypothetical protein
VFGPTIVAIRKVTNAPILIAETAIAKIATEASEIADICTGIRTFEDLGFIWFDMNKPNEPYRLEGENDAIAVLQRQIRPWRLEHTP